jgi:tetratricopeptide (TPR) repeat protein
MLRLMAILLAGASAWAADGQVSPRELIEGGHFKRARALVDARNANDAETLYLQATLKQIYGELDAAQKLAERAVAANPKEAQYHYRLSDITGEMAQKASVFRQVGLGRTFKKECDAALALDPNHVEALKNMMQFYLHAPGIVGGDKAKAHAIADQLMKLDPVEGYLAQIMLARMDKQNARADELVDRSMQMRAETYSAHLWLASYLASQKFRKYPEAEQHAREAVRMHPDRIGGSSLLAAILVREDKWPELDAALAQAEKDNPDSLVPYYRAGNALLDRKIDLARAERYFRKYLSQEPEMRTPNLAAAHWRLGLVLEQAGRKPDAIAEWQAAVKLDPNSQAKQELKRIK